MTGRAGLLLVMLLLGLRPVWAADGSATERLMRVAECIRAAGDLKGAAREAFMSQCQAKDAGAGQGIAPQVPAPAAAQAPTVSAAAEPANGMPPQERILGCATGSRSMQGEARAAYLKQCLAGNTHDPATDVERARRRTACDSQAHAQPEAERQAFVDACMSGTLAVAPNTAGSLLVPSLQQDSEPRRRAACNVLAQDRQGAARKAFIEQCTAARPAAVAPAPPPATQLSAKERLVRSQHCAEQARAKLKESGQVMAYMNACMAGREWPDAH